jgi:hypothetical protein
VVDVSVREARRLFTYHQTVRVRGQNVGNVGWTGREIVAFRLHLPSKIRDQNSGGSAAATFSRGTTAGRSVRGVPLRSTRRWIRSRLLPHALAVRRDVVHRRGGVRLRDLVGDGKGPAAVPAEANPMTSVLIRPNATREGQVAAGWGPASC